MTLFVDASALVAMITGESERDAFITRVEHDGNALWSAMSCWETVSALRSSYRFDIDEARGEVENTARVLALRLIAIGESELSTALDAYQIYGKGRHPAKLNMGDCFAYACAKTHGAELLYKGNDFALTDLA
ncbi:type II toxin-antitoxin system VapC family toxin [Sphingomonas sp. PAMC26645]|uniref:type II toxin-antitoxin system VapC family toxin n=1 Tax=Sphingomonas sp. PAMC26645 TaxID=2565555 RepID=UPI00109E2836|nr:type II toxin-antitoxin system VapC family toxin [Sphingomonas sp. PAMC26645]QCB43533.1 type II toxin-antitoxin system VapC family toxin [Sphingomonas sp. PAMC26645]